MIKSQSNTPPIPRQPNESEFSWGRRLRRHIRRNAPDEYRYYVRGGQSGAKSQRWILPGVFAVLGLFFIGAGYVNNAQIRELNGPNGARGMFIVERVERQQRQGVAEENYPVVPVVTIRGESVVPLYSHDQEFAVGKPVDLRYTQQGKVTASFIDETGHVPSISFVMMFGTGAFFMLLGVLIGIFYRGAVDPEYLNRELARLTAQSS